MALDPKPVTITRVATGSYTGAQTPQPLLMVGDPLADPVASDADVSALIDDTESDTYASLVAACDPLYDFATIAPAIAGYSGAATQTLKHVAGTLTWVTD